MVMCWDRGCKHYNVREKCSFFRIPKHPATRNRWIKLLRRTINPGPGAFICSCHLVDGKKENGPTMLQHLVAKQFKYQNPEKNSRKNICTGVEMSSDHLSTKPETESSTESMPETAMFKASIDGGNYFLRQELQEVSMGLNNLSERLSIDSLKGNVMYYYHWKVEKLSKEDQLLITLMKLRQNFPHDDLAFRFNVSQATVSNIILTWLHVLHEILFKQLMQNIPYRDINKLCLPNSFSTFTNCRIILAT